VVQPLPNGALLLSINLGELVSTLADRNASRDEVDTILAGLSCEIVPFDERLALRSALLRPATRRLGLSLGDRACPALAQVRGLPVHSAERSWASLDLPVDIRVIR
jgi:PIN domain nuclease of toxin-antitoxin system